MTLKKKSLMTIITALCFTFGTAPNAKTQKQDLKDLQAIQAILEDPSKPLIMSPAEPKWSQATLSLPNGAECTILEGDPHQPAPFLIRVKLPAHYEIPAHWNVADEHLTVISGTLYLGLGDTLDIKKSKALPAGSFARIPAKTHHYSYVQEETIVQYHGIGPWGIEYLSKENEDKDGSGTPTSTSLAPSLKPTKATQ